MVQEYGRYFGLPTCCLRGGCLTGPNHSGVELHGFLSYLVKSNVEGRGTAFMVTRANRFVTTSMPMMSRGSSSCSSGVPGWAGVYDLGGGRENSCSILEAFKQVEAMTGTPMQYDYLEQNREGDHICYVSDLTKMKSHYPEWGITKSLTDILHETIVAWNTRLGPGR